MSQLHQHLPPLAAGSLATAALLGKLLPTRAAGVGFATLGGLAGLCLAATIVLTPATAGLWMTDGPAPAVAITVTLITLAILRFCMRHVDDRAGRTDLMTGVSLVSASVLIFLLSGHLALTWAGWCGAGVLLHGLLTRDRTRPDAVFIARKKFLFGRISDALLAAGLVLIYRAHDTAMIADICAHPGKTPPGAVALLAAAAVIRSAQLPFHTWLPETMEAPAPVSALMHAGIVNAGGFLLIRFAPVMTTLPAAMHALALLGALTAAYGAVCMTAQPEAKRALAYSTVAQMGFLMFTCGIGCFGAATLHLIAHAIYKADAFLSAGDAARAPARSAIRLSPAGMIGALFAAAAMVLAVLISGETQLRPAETLLLLFYATALAYGLARAAAGPRAAALLPRSLAAATAVLAAWWGLHGLSERLTPTTAHTPPTGLLLALGALPPLLLLFQGALASGRFTRANRALHAHALHGFHLNTLLSRLLASLAPKNPSSR